MDDYRVHKYYRPTGFGWRWLVYNYILTDRYFRTLLNFGPTCGGITAITLLLLILVLSYTMSCWGTFLTNAQTFRERSLETDKVLPRRESVLQVKPVYNCINQHLQQADIFLDKTKKVVRKEQLEVEIMNSRINSINELLQPGHKSQWNLSQSPKGYFRDIHTPAVNSQ